MSYCSIHLQHIMHILCTYQGLVRQNDEQHLQEMHAQQMQYLVMLHNPQRRTQPRQEERDLFLMNR